MESNKKTGRIIGVLLLLMFIIGYTNYQKLRVQAFTYESYLSELPQITDKIGLTSLLGFIMAILAIVVAVLFLPIFKKYNYRLAFLYLSFCVVYAVAYSVENIFLLTLMEFSKEGLNESLNNTDTFKIVGVGFYHLHLWMHLGLLLISCFNVFVLYLTLFLSKLVPRVISGFGIIAVSIMLFEMSKRLFGGHLNETLFMPLGIVQILFPIWLIIKGLNTYKKIESEEITK